MMHVPEGANIDAKRKMLRRINDAIVEAYHVPKFMIFMQAYPLDRVALDGGLHSDNKARVQAVVACRALSTRTEDAHSDDRPDRGDVRESPEATEALKLLLQISVAAQATTISSRR